MLQNRVDPFGRLIKTPERGTWLGNRGVLHNEAQRIVRPYKVKAWITCKLNYKGRHREIMKPNRWTELFFFDEATSFSAGHRPCFQCRNTDHQRFKRFWINGNPQYGFSMKTPINKIDEVIHNERLDDNRIKVTYEENIKELPDGTFILKDEKSYLIYRGGLRLWSPVGYASMIPFSKNDKITVLTPYSIVNTLRAGYVPQIGT